MLFLLICLGSRIGRLGRGHRQLEYKCNAPSGKLGSSGVLSYLGSSQLLRVTTVSYKQDPSASKVKHSYFVFSPLSITSVDSHLPIRSLVSISCLLHDVIANAITHSKIE